MKFTVISCLLIPCACLLSEEEEEEEEGPYDPTQAKYPGDLTDYYSLLFLLFNSVLLFVIQVNIPRKVSSKVIKVSCWSDKHDIAVLAVLINFCRDNSRLL